MTSDPDARRKALSRMMYTKALQRVREAREKTVGASRRVHRAYDHIPGYGEPTPPRRPRLRDRRSGYYSSSSSDSNSNSNSNATGMARVRHALSKGPKMFSGHEIPGDVWLTARDVVQARHRKAKTKPPRGWESLEVGPEAVTILLKRKAAEAAKVPAAAAATEATRRAYSPVRPSPFATPARKNWAEFLAQDLLTGGQRPGPWVPNPDGAVFSPGVAGGRKTKTKTRELSRNRVIRLTLDNLRVTLAPVDENVIGMFGRLLKKGGPYPWSSTLATVKASRDMAIRRAGKRQTFFSGLSDESFSVLAWWWEARVAASESWTGRGKEDFVGSFTTGPNEDGLTKEQTAEVHVQFFRILFLMGTKWKAKKTGKSAPRLYVSSDSNSNSNEAASMLSMGAHMWTLAPREVDGAPGTEDGSKGNGAVSVRRQFTWMDRFKAQAARP